MKLHVRSVEHLEEVIDRFTPYGQTTTSIIQSSPVARRGARAPLDERRRELVDPAPAVEVADDRILDLLVAGFGEHGPRPPEHHAADQADERRR